MKSPKALLKSPCCLYVMGGVVLLFAILAVLVGSFVIFWTTESQPLPTVNGPEQPALLNSLNATLVSVHGSDELQVLSVPSLTSRSFQAQDRVWAVSGPDSTGRAIYSVSQGAVVKSMQIDIAKGKRSEITSHRGPEPFWEQSAFSSPALSPTSGRLAFRRTDSPMLPMQDRSTAWTPSKSGASMASDSPCTRRQTTPTTLHGNHTPSFWRSWSM